MAEGGRTWRTWQVLVVAMAALVIGILAGAGTSEQDETVSAGGQAETTTAPDGETQPTSASATAAPTTAAPTTAAGPKTEFGNGTHRVGVDIAPGTYVAPGGQGCYWERQSVFGGGGADSIIANEFARGGQVVVTIASTDKGFRTNGCGTWKRG